MPNSLDELINNAKAILKAKAHVDAMTPEQKAEMIRKQAESWARAEMSWPKSNYHFENGVKVYHSYEDYLND